METNPNKQFRLAAFWALLGAFDTLAAFPYLIEISPPPSVLPLPGLAIIGAIWICLWLSLLALGIGIRDTVSFLCRYCFARYR